MLARLKRAAEIQGRAPTDFVVLLPMKPRAGSGYDGTKPEQHRYRY
jgi:hypothetical protein